MAAAATLLLPLAVQRPLRPAAGRNPVQRPAAPTAPEPLQAAVEENVLGPRTGQLWISDTGDRAAVELLAPADTVQQENAGPFRRTAPEMPGWRWRRARSPGRPRLGVATRRLPLASTCERCYACKQAATDQA
jgi:hypothetical protein